MIRSLILTVLFVGCSEATPSSKNQERLLLITGCGRSGTKYIAELLSASGLNIYHESSVGKKRKDCSLVAWELAVDGKYPLWLPPLKNLHFKHVFHQVRDPLDVISSWYENNSADAGWKYIYDHIPEIKPTETRLIRCAKYWYYWNLEAEKKASWRYRVEDIDLVFEEMEKRIGVSLDRKPLTTLKRNIHTRKPISHKVTWSELKECLPERDFENVQAMALKYGYAVEDVIVD